MIRDRGVVRAVPLLGKIAPQDPLRREWLIWLGLPRYTASIVDDAFDPLRFLSHHGAAERSLSPGDVVPGLMVVHDRLILIDRMQELEIALVARWQAV
ncbi:MAG TPA: hypothetical protein VND96_13305 [Candidatus Micrarchaeaceae archaeon]|nr:hypothetical protein [Candidatus Micrarchaeaceae archaeon]